MRAPRDYRFSHCGEEAESHIVAMYQGGMPMTAIGYEFFIAQTTVAMVLERHGVESRKKGTREALAWRYAHPKVRS